MAENETIKPIYKNMIAWTAVMFVLAVMSRNTSLEPVSGLFGLAGIVLFVFAVRNRINKQRSSNDVVEQENPVVLAAREIENGKLPIFKNSPIVREGEVTHFYCKAVRYITK